MVLLDLQMIVTMNLTLLGYLLTISRTYQEQLRRIQMARLTSFGAILFISFLMLFPKTCSAMISVGDLSKKQAEELGITMHHRKNGDAGVKVWMEFEKVGILDKFSYCELRMDDTRGRHLLSAKLQPRPIVHGQPKETVSVAFSASPAQLENCAFMIVAYGSSEGDVGYMLHVKDFLNMKKTAAVDIDAKSQHPEWSTLVSLFGRLKDSDYVVDYTSKHGMRELSKGSSGSYVPQDWAYSLMFRDNRIETIVLRASPSTEDYGEKHWRPYSQSMPGELSPQDSRAEVIKKLGKPTTLGGDRWLHNGLVLWVHFDKAEKSIFELLMSLQP